MYWINFLLLISSCLFLFLYKKEKNKNIKIETINKEVEKNNKEIYKRNEELTSQSIKLYEDIQYNQSILDKTQQWIKESEQVSRDAFENYVDSLDKEYELKEKEYQEAIQLLNNSYEEIQNKINAEIDQIRTDLDKISSTRAAAIQAQLEEEKIQQQAEFYSLSIDETDKREVKILQSIESELRDPRPIRMIIWQAYYSKKANELASRVLGTEDKCGIYKITNKTNKLCYIGQAKKIRERWREHMKCGLGIDTPANNKLYIAMKKEGLDNFTFELLEACQIPDLDEKEKFYINLYNSYHYGYNSNIGIRKS